VKFGKLTFGTNKFQKQIQYNLTNPGNTLPHNLNFGTMRQFE